MIKEISTRIDNVYGETIKVVPAFKVGDHQVVICITEKDVQIWLDEDDYTRPMVIINVLKMYEKHEKGDQL